MSGHGANGCEVETSWNLVAGAAAGVEAARAEFARRYEPVVRAYFTARWRGRAACEEIDDAVQDTFLDCFRREGALTRADPAKPQRFRAFLYGVTRIVAGRTERARGLRRARLPRGESAIDGAPSPHESLARTFDRAWAEALMARAVRTHEARAQAAGSAARRRFELLELRFRVGLPIRDVAQRWGVDAAWLHHEYATARAEFKSALLDVVRAEHGDAGVEARCARLLESFG